MGVISNGSNPFSGLIEDAPYNIGDLEQVLQDVAEGIDSHDLVVSEQRRSRKVKHRTPAKPTSFTVYNKQLGAKKYRRYENSLELMALASAEDFEELTIDDLVTRKVSAFARLIENPENLKLWNDFVNCSEEEQNRILMNECNECGCAEPQTANRPSTSSGDQRLATAPLNPDECFRKVDNRFRALLKRKHLAMGILAQIEADVTSFFTEWPRAVYISKLPNGYDRLLLHALCQYLSLISRSFSDKGTRQTRVVNPREIFQVPEVLLTQYIEKHFLSQH